MANYYWVGGNANWDGTNPLLKWSSTSGGAPDKITDPSTSDDVFFDANSGAVTVTVITTTGICKNLNFSGFSGTFTGSTALNIYGSLTLGASMTLTYDGNITFKATSGTQSITFNGKSFSGGSGFTFDGVGGTWQLADAVVTDGPFILTNGSLDLNNQNLTCKTFASSNTNTRVLTLGSGTLTLTGSGTVWDLTTVTNLTFNANTSTIKFTNTSNTNKTMWLGGQTYYDIWNATSGTGDEWLFRDDGCTFHNIKIDAGRKVKFFAGTFFTTSLTILGTVGNNVILTELSGVWTISVASGIIAIDYVTLDHSTATGGATFYAGANSTDAGNNTGWSFTSPGSPSSSLSASISKSPSSSQSPSSSKSSSISKSPSLSGSASPSSSASASQSPSSSVSLSPSPSPINWDNTNKSSDPTWDDQNRSSDPTFDNTNKSSDPTWDNTNKTVV